MGAMNTSSGQQISQLGASYQFKAATKDTRKLKHSLNKTKLYNSKLMVKTNLIFDSLHMTSFACDAPIFPIMSK